MFPKAGRSRSWKTADIVDAVYRALLGRSPENDQVVQWAERFPTLEHYLKSVVASPEFREGRLAQLIGFDRAFIEGEPNEIDIHVGLEERRAILAVVSRVWKSLGQRDPYFSVLSHDAYRGEPDAERLETFYAGGELEADGILQILRRSGVESEEPADVVELGCGVGRVSLWLARRFPRVYGIDISPRHLELARRQLERRGVKGFVPLHIDSLTGLEQVPAYDLFYSRMTLQHNPPPIQHAMLDSLLAKARADALAIFQIPTYRDGYGFSAREYLAASHTIDEMETHALPQPVIYELLQRHGFDLLEVFWDNCMGDTRWHSQLFVARRRADEVGGGRS